MRRWTWVLVGVTAGLAALGAHAGEGRAARRVVLKGPVNDFLVESFDKSLREALRPPVPKKDEKSAAARKVDLLLLDLETTPGPLGAALRLSSAIQDLRKQNIETVGLVREPGAAPNTLLALACDRLMMFAKARLAPLDPAAFVPPASAEETKQLLEAVERFSAPRPRLKTLYRSLVEPASDVYAVVFKGREGQGAFYTGEEYKRLMAAPPEAVGEMKLVAAAGARPELSAADAERFGVSLGTVAGLSDAASRLRVAESDLRGIGAEAAPIAAAKPAAPAPALKPEEEPPPPPPRSVGTSDLVVFIPLDGMVGDGMRYSLERRLREAERLRPAMVVFEIDTYGGRLDSALEISKMIFLLSGPRTVAFITSKAISAGSLIAVACDEIVMSTGSTMGDCQIVDSQGQAVSREKIETVLRAWFRAFCAGKFPIALALKMVSEDLEVYELRTRDGRPLYLTGIEYENLTPEERDQYASSKKLFAEKTLLTMTDREARAFGFSRATLNSRQELLALYGLGGRRIIVLGWSWSEALVRLLDVAGPFLLALGVLAIFIEMKSPGFGIIGIAGLALIALFFFGKYMAGLAEVWEILLFLVGLVLLLIEVFVTPGFGVLGVAGLVAMLAGVVLALQPFLVPTTPFEWHLFEWNIVSLGLSAVGIFAGAVLLARYLHRAPYIGKIVLAQPLPSTAPTAVTVSVSPPPPALAEELRARGLVGKCGRALSMLRPAGRADFDGVPLDVVTQGDFITPGEPVEICEVHGSRLIVRRVV